MELIHNKKQLIFVSNEILLDNGFFVLLEEVDYKVRNFELDELDLRICVDQSIHKKLEYYKQNNHRRELKRVQGILMVLKSLQLYEEINTEEFTNFEPLLNLIQQHQFDDVIFLTNTKSIAQRLYLIEEAQSFMYEHFVEGKLSPWVLQKPKKEEVKPAVEAKPKEKERIVKKEHSIPKQLEEAFHTKETSKYITVVDHEDLDYVYSPQFGYLKLEKDNIMAGGEGKIYKTYGDHLVKIYTKEERRYELVKKIQLMIDMDLRNSHIIWPKDIVYYQNEFVGYVMDEVENAEGLDMGRIYSFLNLPYKERYKICIDLLKMIEYLHDKGIIIGDLKFDNVMYRESTKELFIIDSASFQVADYSCGVFNADYTHENLKGMNLREVLRTLEEEYFPINKILFEVLMGKGPFYDFKTGEVGSDVEREFHYPLEPKENITNQQHPLFFWTHTDERIRHNFYDYFRNGIATEPRDWINLLESILKEAN